MGGYIVKIAETPNFVWEVHVNLSGDRPKHWMEIHDKRNERRWIEMRESSSDDAPQFDAFGEFLDELEKESQGNRQYTALTREQLTLANMWERMNKAENDLISYRRRYEELEGVFRELKKHMPRD